ncbi:MAG: metal ABC transporter permease [Candidatus Jorgensenbacteria bacterium]|nr:metal ABC transporter permease [Candidatus Jorgensenbacteria bacterium]
MTELLTLTTLSGILVAAASGIVGSLLTLRKMTLLSDALSHVALPGIAIGIVFKFNPLFGGVALLFVGVLLIWYIEMKTRLAVESITGVLFVTALSLGALLIPEQDLLEAFFGNAQNITLEQALAQAVISIGIIATALYLLKPLALSSIAPDLATSSRISQPKMELLLLILIALTIAVGISFVGVLLMSALLIIPSVTAKNIAGSFKGFITLSIELAVIALLSGLVISRIYPINPSFATALVSSAIFFISLLIKRPTR